MGEAPRLRGAGEPRTWPETVPKGPRTFTRDSPESPPLVAPEPGAGLVVGALRRGPSEVSFDAQQRPPREVREEGPAGPWNNGAPKGPASEDVPLQARERPDKQHRAGLF